MNAAGSHDWVRSRIARWRAGLLEDHEAAQVAEHLGVCADCRAVSEAFAGPAWPEPGSHVPASVLAEWPRARRALRGLERALVRHHLERCPDCRQDLELLGHEPRLDFVPELESAPAGARAPTPGEREEARPVLSGAPPPPVAVIRVVRGERRRWDRALAAWASLATAAAAIAIVGYVRRPVLEGIPAPLMVTLGTPAVAPPPAREGEPSLRIAPRPRSLSGPAHGPRGGKVTVIPVVGPVRSLALTVHPLDVPDTSWVAISLVASNGDTLFRVRHRQWEFFPKRVLVIDGERSPLQPGRYALVLESLMRGGGSAPWPMSRYLFELRPRDR